ncbi:hypothetical protein BAE44_0014863 [Dichanthelium oligosanthes]|uniref:Uncharacterized protein n=1 Tax=Dichanthelium oligosanthes TaxID=888268 RepID=A0A1E5VG64_9POAL|nr:hypothetical protein BAE44_0014863 [Dichanthelium oligosanthes]
MVVVNWSAVAGVGQVQRTTLFLYGTGTYNCADILITNDFKAHLRIAVAPHPLGVIKESIEPGIEASRDENTSNFSDVCENNKSSHCSHRGMVLECISGSDGKEGIAKAASILYSASCKGLAYTHGYKIDTVFTEADMACALRAAGGGGPEPDLLLVYGPAYGSAENNELWFHCESLVSVLTETSKLWICFAAETPHQVSASTALS